MSNNLANLMVGFGLDLSALEKGAPEAYKLINSQSLAMSAEMKRTAREGAESFRLIDEALGIHISRPLTKILTQQFPALAEGLASVLGAGVVGALGAAAFEGFEKISKSIEHAQKAEEDYSKAVRHTQDVIADLGAAHARTMKEIELQLAEQQKKPGAKLAAVDFRIDSAALDEAKKQIGEISEAMDKESKAATEAGKWTTQFWAAVGYVAANFFSSGSGADEASKKFESFHHVLEDIMRAASADPLKGIRESLIRVNQEMSTTGAEIVQKMTLQQHQQAMGFTFDTPGGQKGARLPPVDPAVLASQQKYFEMLKAQSQALEDILKEDTGHRQVAAGVSDEAERQLKAQQAIAALQKDIAASMAKLQPQTDPFVKISAEIDEMREKAVANLAAITTATKDGLISPAVLARSEAQFAAFVANLKRLKNELDSDVLRGELPKNALAAPFSGTSTPASIAATPVVPTLGSGGTAGAQFDAFSKDSLAQIKASAAAYQDLVTPQQKYQLAQQELNLLLEKGLIDQTAYTAALQKASQQFVEAEDRLHKMQEDLQKLLQRSDDARAGIQAFFLQLELDSAQNGKFAFDLLNQGLKGFEDELTKAVFTGKAKWEDLFRSMTETAFKFTLNKEIAGLFQMAGGTSIGKSMGLSGLLPAQGAGGAGGAALTMAASTLQTGSTTLITAATELQAAATTLQAGGAVGGGGGPIGDFLSSFAGYASGTDDAPGGLAWVGEQGPELLNLPGGSSVTPAASLRSGAGDSHYYIDAKGAEIGVEEKIVRALQYAEPRFIGKALANFTEVQRRTAGRQR